MSASSNLVLGFVPSQCTLGALRQVAHNLGLEEDLSIGPLSLSGEGGSTMAGGLGKANGCLHSRRAGREVCSAAGVGGSACQEESKGSHNSVEGVGGAWTGDKSVSGAEVSGRVRGGGAIGKPVRMWAVLWPVLEWIGERGVGTHLVIRCSWHFHAARLHAVCLRPPGVASAAGWALCNLLLWAGLMWVAQDVGHVAKHNFAARKRSMLLNAAGWTLCDLLLWAALVWVEAHIDPVSRRLCNLAFILWVCAFCGALLLPLLLAQETSLYVYGLNSPVALGGHGPSPARRSPVLLLALPHA
eukprot:1154968-Pelagomonas_calceolata.AAC.4